MYNTFKNNHSSTFWRMFHQHAHKFWWHGITCPCLGRQTNFSGCYISGISCTLVMLIMDQFNTIWFVPTCIWLCAMIKGSQCGCHFRFKLHVTNGVTWWSAIFCNCQQGESIMNGITHDYEVSNFTYLLWWWFRHDLGFKIFLLSGTQC